MEAVVVVALLALVVWVVGGPLRRDAVERDLDALRGARADLEAEKAAKYREIRDAELDHRTGKLSDADWRAIDRELRAEAIELLHRLDALGPAPEEGSQDERAGAGGAASASRGDDAAGVATQTTPGDAAAPSRGASPDPSARGR